MHLLDSSAIILILKRLQEESIEVLEGKVTLNLAIYEINNVIWRQCVLEDLISPKEAINRAEEIAQILEIMKIEDIKSSVELGETMKQAIEQKLTFYDASYLQVAKSRGYTLVTEDKKLLEKSKNVNIKTITVEEFLNVIRLGNI